MQKYQNFVVEAGRQCWPGDAFGEEHKLATRPDDMRADQWIYNIIKVCNAQPNNLHASESLTQLLREVSCLQQSQHSL